MRKLHARKGGFTLIELMIVVAIIGILAAIAIPNFLMFQLRSKTGEAKVNLAAIRTAEEGYFAEFGGYVAQAAAFPAAPAIGSQKRPWVAGSAFDQLGWGPEGEVFFDYAVQAATAGAVSYTAEAQGDLDGNGTPSEFGYIHPVAGGTTGPAAAVATTCATTGIYNPATAGVDLLNTVGPCTNQDGQSLF